MVRVRLDEGRYSLYARRDGRLGIISPVTGMPATNFEVLGLEYSDTSDEPYWVQGLNARIIVDRHLARLNEGIQNP